MADRTTMRHIPPPRPALAPPPGVIPNPTIPEVKSLPNPIMRPTRRR